MEKPEVKSIYDFYKSPDGQDCLEKTYYLTKYTGILGVTVGLMDIGMVSFPQKIIHGVYRILNYAPVYAMMGFSLASTVCIAGQLRKKDDFVNHGLGGIVAGCVYGAKCGSAVTGGRVGGIIAVIVSVSKYLKDNNIPFAKLQTKKYDTYSSRYDFSIKMFEDPGRPLDP